MHGHAPQLLKADTGPAGYVPKMAEWLPRRIIEGRLTWWPDIGVGYYPVKTGLEPYNRDYWNKYVEMSNTQMGYDLNNVRRQLVERHHGNGVLVDVGIGSGAFIQARGQNTWGFDVNAVAADWLRERGLWWDPHFGNPPAISLWDVIEHLPDPQALMAHVGQWVFISTPIYQDHEHVLRSKHFRPDEHFWYYTRDGLVYLMRLMGFDLAECNVLETVLGREDIGSFAFKRRSDSHANRSLL